MIPEKELEGGHIYLVESPDFNIAYWDGELFHGVTWNNMYGYRMVEAAHFERGVKEYGLVKPLTRLSREPLQFGSLNRNVLLALDCADAVATIKENGVLSND